MLAHFVIRDTSSKLLDSGCSTHKSQPGLLVFFASEVQPSQVRLRLPTFPGKTNFLGSRYPRDAQRDYSKQAMLCESVSQAISAISLAC